jgi:RHS repeat-associated protein
MRINERTYSATAYRFGFNGKEQDDQVSGAGNCIAFEARIYDPRLGKFFSPDPLEMIFVWQSTYVFAANNPIALIDFLGMGSGDSKQIKKQEIKSGQTPGQVAKDAGMTLKEMASLPENKSIYTGKDYSYEELWNKDNWSFQAGGEVNVYDRSNSKNIPEKTEPKLPSISVYESDPAGTDGMGILDVILAPIFEYTAQKLDELGVKNQRAKSLIMITPIVVATILTKRPYVKTLAKTTSSLVETASVILKPGGMYIGTQVGKNVAIRTVTQAEAQSLVNRLITSGAKLSPKPSYPGTWYQLNSGGGFGVRSAVSQQSAKLGSSGAIDIDIPGIALKNLKY